MAYLKPQSPLQHKDGDYFYPLTTVDQVILEDGTRLNTRLEDIENFDPSSLVFVGDESVDSVTAPLNADTLGGQLPTYYARATQVTPRSLLDNGYFLNLVNQRGSTSYTGSGYGIDRWRTNFSGDTVEITNNGIKNTNQSTVAGWHLHQILENCARYIGKTLTIAANVKDISTQYLRLIFSFRDSEDAEISNVKTSCINGVNLISGIVPEGTVKIRAGFYGYSGMVEGDYVELEWIALYEGEYTAETLPEYQSKGYGAELAECQRYYRRIENPTGNMVILQAVAYNATSMYGVLPFSMRTEKPAINFSNIVWTNTSISTAPSIKSIRASRSSGGVTAIALTVEDATPGTMYNIWTSANGGYLEVSADL